MALVFTVLLVCVLAGAMVSFVIMGLRQHRRGLSLARGAHGTDLHFSQSDPFDVPRRYAGFALLSRGHSPRANNVTHGRIEGLSVRAFDFRSEMGHGPQRVSRHESVVVIEAGYYLPAALMWNDRDVQQASLLAGQCDKHVGCWTCGGDDELAAVLAGTCVAMGLRRVNMQAMGSALMVFGAPPRETGRYILSHAEIGQFVHVLQTWRPKAESCQPGDGKPLTGELPNLKIENGPGSC